MQKKHYKLRYLPLFEEDLTNIVEYIAWNLHNTLAAEEFLDDVQKAIRDRLTSSNSFEKFHSAKERLHLGHVYELGYPKCSCPDVLSGKEHDVSFCECSRQSILYVLHSLVPDKEITVEILHTVLGGAENCRFKATVE